MLSQAVSKLPSCCTCCPARNAAFLSNVEAEVTQQLLRLGSHPSMVVFGGNNEVEQSLGWYAETKDNVPLYVTDYSALFVDTIGKVASKVCVGSEGCDAVGSSLPTAGWWRRCLAWGMQGLQSVAPV
jgi:beta-galactosidase/beta-glucuronidase